MALKLDIDKKRKLEHLLGALSTPDERQELQKLDALKIQEIVSFFNEIETDHQDRYKNLERYLGLILQSFDHYRQAVVKYNERVSGSIGAMAETLVEKLEDMGGKITTSYEKNKPFDAAGVYKDMLNQLSAVNKNIKEKPVPVWNWPQYASVGVRNKSFSNINPATDPFNIGDYDEFVGTYTGTNLTTAVFKLNSVTVCTLNLTYDGSNNLTHVTKS